MTPNRKMLNLLITNELTAKMLKEMHPNLVLNEELVETVLRVQQRRRMNKEMLSLLAEMLVEFAKEGESNSKWLIEYFKSRDELHDFHKQVIKMMKKEIPNINLSEVMDFYAI